MVALVSEKNSASVETLVSLPTVAKHMKHMGLKSRYSSKYKPTTDSSHKEPIAENILNRDFFSFSMSKKCISDITYLPTKDMVMS